MTITVNFQYLTVRIWLKGAGAAFNAFKGEIFEYLLPNQHFYMDFGGNSQI